MIELAGVSKRYWLRSSGKAALKRTAKRLLGHKACRPEHWALRDISLQVKSGERLALVGANGSGKSTLLRLVSGVTRATRGQVRVEGRVGGVVDLGAGFHGDLTGYENIFLHGTLLGLSRAQVRERLDAIVDFTELGDFLNGPVRHYSLGMFLRLGFAVAVHSDPDILVIDEALAVGDGYFQWKCLRRIDEMVNEGRTLLFVSHAAASAESVCDRAAWIDAGQLRNVGPSSDIVSEYHDYVFSNLLTSDPVPGEIHVAALAPHARVGSGDVVMNDVRLVDVEGRARRSFPTGQSMLIETTLFAHKETRNVTFGWAIERAGTGAGATAGLSSEHGHTFHVRAGETGMRLRFPELQLHPGHYTLTIVLAEAAPHEVGGRGPLYDAHIKLYPFLVTEPTDESSDPLGFSDRVLKLPARTEIEFDDNNANIA